VLSYKEAATWKGADSIYDFWELCGRPCPGPNYLLAPARRHTLMDSLQREAARVRPTFNVVANQLVDDDTELKAWAEPLTQWAIENTSVVTPNQLARFAVEAAYDLRVRSRIKELMADPRPSRWWWDDLLDGRGRRQRHLVTDQQGDGYFPPFLGSEIWGLRKLLMDWEQVFTGNAVVEWPWPFAYRVRSFLDPIRPTLTSLLAAARIIDDNYNTPTVVALEMGHSLAAQALAAMLFGATVHTDCELYPQDINAHRVSPGTADVVVVNIACMRLIAYTAAVVAGGLKHVSRKKNDGFHPERWKDYDISQVRPILERAVEYLHEGGLLILLGDEEDGVHHEAIKVVPTLGDARPYSIEGRDTVAKPFYTFRPRPAWRPFDIQAPTNRFVSAWRWFG